ncbi:MAG: Holliday junction resolvase RuvX [Blastocatellia bacterium]
MRVLAVDYGTRATGLAISDELQLTVRPLATIRSLARSSARSSAGSLGRSSDSSTVRRAGTSGDRRAKVDVAAEILRYVADYEVGELVVGLPLNMDGTHGEAARRVDRLIESLRGAIDIPVIAVDERLTSREADQLLRASGATERERRVKSDEYAAVIILEDFLASRQRRQDLLDLPD